MAGETHPPQISPADGPTHFCKVIGNAQRRQGNSEIISLFLQYNCRSVVSIPKWKFLLSTLMCSFDRKEKPLREAL